MPPKVTTWIDAQGREHSVETPRGNGWTEQVWQDEHDASVALAQDIWPPV